MKNNGLLKKQNEKNMLDVLFAQRYYYNIANMLDFINFVILLIICLFNFFEIKSDIIQIFANILLFLFSILLNNLVNKNILLGADLKKYFDYKLFNFKLEDDFQKKCLGLVNDVLNKNIKNYKQQISNDGTSRPPGLKNWYFDENKSNKIDLIKSAQSQNIKWDKNISKIYLKCLIIIFISFLSIYILISMIRNYSILKFIAGFIPLLSLLAYFIQKFKDYISVNKQTGIIENMLHYTNKSKNMLLEIQKKIDDRRRKNFCPPNIIHKVIAKRLHEKEKYINKNLNNY